MNVGHTASLIEIREELCAASTAGASRHFLIKG